MMVSRLFIYPIKSLGGIEVTTSTIESRGLRHDRRFMLIDDNQKFLTQRNFPKLATWRMSLSNSGFWITPDFSSDKLEIPFQVTEGEELNVQIWDDVVKAIVVSSEANRFFTDRLGINCRLVYMPDDSRRSVDPKYGDKEDITSFSDGYPILVIGTASLDDLNTRLKEKISWDRFRPSIVVETEIPFVEDSWKSLKIGDLEIKLVKPCARCVMTTINQQTGNTGQEPLRTLAGFRAEGNKVLFGMNAIPVSTSGVISRGDAFSAEF